MSQDNVLRSLWRNRLFRNAGDTGLHVTPRLDKQSVGKLSVGRSYFFTLDSESGCGGFLSKKGPKFSNFFYSLRVPRIHNVVF
jgi:hypothetical protein